MATNRDFTPIAPQRSTKSLEEIKAVDAEAAEHGLSYGRFVEKMLLKNKFTKSSEEINCSTVTTARIADVKTE